MKEALKKYLNDEILANGHGVSVDDEDDLLMSGLVDSIGVMRLVAFIEETFDIRVPPEDVTIESFRTVAAIAGYLETRKD